MITIDKQAKILRKKLKNKINLIVVKNYIKELGYDVIYLNTDEGDQALLAYDIYREAQGVSAFTYVDSVKIVFVDVNEHISDQLILLLHELGHILLGHVGDGEIMQRDTKVMELEASAFAYAVLHPPKSKYFMRICTYICIAVLFFGGGSYTHSHIEQKYPVNNTVGSDSPVSNNTENVYITPTGKSYHRDTCKYVFDKDCAALSVSEAKKIFTPCKVCNP